MTRPIGAMSDDEYAEHMRSGPPSKVTAPAAMDIHLATDGALTAPQPNKDRNMSKGTTTARKTPLAQFNTDKLYGKWTVEIQTRDKLCGGTPRTPEMIEGWVKAKTGYSDEQAKELAAEAIEDIQGQLTDASWNGFRADERGLYIETRQVKAMLRECFTVQRLFVKRRGSKQIYQHGLEIKGAEHPRRIYLDRGEPDGCDESPIHVMTPQGPRSALKRVDYVKGALLSFELWRYKTIPQETRHIGEEALVAALTLAQENGLGADRSQGQGKFDVVGFEAQADEK